MKDLRKTSTPMCLARAACALAVFCAGPALASNPWIESHVSASYGYVLGKGEAAGRGLTVASSSKSGDPKVRAPRKAAVPAAPAARPTSGS